MQPTLRLLEELKQWTNIATPAARSIVRKIIHDAHPEPLHTHQIWQKSQADFPLSEEAMESQTIKLARLLRRTGPAQPPNAIHHIRSLRYLKHVILPDLARRDEIVKVHRVRPATSDEISIAAAMKPLSLSQRKNRGALGPGQQPVRPRSGQVDEWVWRLKTAHDAEWQVIREKVKQEKRAKRQSKDRGHMEGRLSHNQQRTSWEDGQKNSFLSGRNFKNIGNGP